VGDPDARFAEDRLRALRAIRFAARFGFAIEPATWQGICRSAPHLGRLSAERVKQELEKTMEQVRRPSTALTRWRDSGAFGTLVPALAQVPDRYLFATDALAHPGPRTRPLRRSLRLAALCCALDAKTATRVLRDLKFSNLDVATVGALVGTWHALSEEIGGSLQAAAPISDATLRAWAARIGRLRVSAFGRLAAALWAGALAAGESAPSAGAWRAVYRRLLVIAFRDPLDIADLAVDGDDLRRAGIPHGPALGRTLQHLVGYVLEDPTRNESASLLAEAHRLAANPG
jgi:tRNA nucleotidyltransferase (CCA-adding enzyme)